MTLGSPNLTPYPSDWHGLTCWLDHCWIYQQIMVSQPVIIIIIIIIILWLIFTILLKIF